MPFILSEIIKDIYSEYQALPNGRTPIGVDANGDPFMGNLALKENADCPRVVWLFDKGSFGDAAIKGGGDPTETAGESQPHYQALATYNVWIWQETLQDCWNVMVDLLAAMRASVFGPNLGAQNFLIPTEKEGRHSEKGETIILTVTLSVPIPIAGTQPPQLVALESHQSTVTEDNGVPDGGGLYTPIETVVVSGPPE